MNRLRDEFLACAALALDEYGGRAWSNLGDEVEQAEHRFALADDIFKVVALLQGALELDYLFFGTVAGDGGANVGEQFLVVPGLLDEVFRAGTNGVHDVADRAVRRNHDDGKIGLHLDDARQQVDTALAGKSKVKKQQIVLVARTKLHARRAIDSSADRESLQGQQGIERFAYRLLVVDDEDPWVSGHTRRALQIKSLGGELSYFRHGSSSSRCPARYPQAHRQRLRDVCPRMGTRAGKQFLRRARSQHGSFRPAPASFRSLRQGR